MLDRTNKIRDIAERLLDERRVDIIIGHKKGTVPMKNSPFFATTPEEIQQLVWDGNCRNNLANFLSRVKDKKVAIVAQGCVSRNVLGLIQEKQVDRGNVYIIGVPCTGMLDKDKVSEAATGEITEVTEDSGKVTIKGRDFEISLDRNELIRSNCAECMHRNPVLFDELAADTVKEQEVANRDEAIKAVEAMSAKERGEFIDEMLSTCVRCYACRDACPLCYCPECFVDKFNPQWCGKSQDSRDVLSYHLIRAYHTAGRCTECGACEDACPMGIKVKMITGKVEKDIRENFDGYEAWTSPEAQPLLVAFKLDDPQPFVKE